VRVDGTTIETTTWADGPEPVTAPPMVASGAGGPAPVMTPAAPPAAAPVRDDSSSMIWIGVGGIGLLLAAALVVVRTLRR